LDIKDVYIISEDDIEKIIDKEQFHSEEQEIHDSIVSYDSEFSILQKIIEANKHKFYHENKIFIKIFIKEIIKEFPKTSDNDLSSKESDFLE
jgi:hypothetical protein